MRKAYKTIGKSTAKIMLIGMLIVAGVVALHETGHYLAGKADGCRNVEVVFLDSEFQTYTKMNCQSPNNLMFLSGLILVVPLCIAMFFVNRSYSLIIFGFNLLISSADFSYFPEILGLIAAGAGFATVIGGEVMIANHYARYLQKTVPWFFR
jgi:hypothetical protein